jgi:hypothetical protein
MPLIGGASEDIAVRDSAHGFGHIWSRILSTRSRRSSMKRKQSTSKTCLPTGKAPRLPAGKPRPRKRGLTRRELEILKAVASLHVATAEDLRLFVAIGSRSYMVRLLRKLSGARDQSNRGYLYRFGTPNSPGNFRRLYCLTRRGRQAVRDHGLEVEGWYRPEKASHYSFSILTHHLAVTQVLVALTLFVRKYPFQLIETRPWFTVATDPPRLTQWIEGQETTISVIPDLWAYIERTHEDPSKIQGFGLWFEIDRGTEAKAKFQQFVLDSINFVRYKGYGAFFNATSVIFVFLAVGATRDYRLARLHTMRQWTMDLLTNEHIPDWAPLFRFSTIDESLYDSMLLFTDPVFYLPDSDTLVSLFPPPPQEQEEAHDNSQTTNLS